MFSCCCDTKKCNVNLNCTLLLSFSVWFRCPYTQFMWSLCGLSLVLLYSKCSEVAEMGDRLATIDMGRKEGGFVSLSFLGGRYPSNTMWPGPRSTSLPSRSWSIQLFGHNRHAPKSGGGSWPFRGEGLGHHLTQCGQGWGLPPYQVASWSIQAFGHNRHRPKITGLLLPFGWGTWVPI